MGRQQCIGCYKTSKSCVLTNVSKWINTNNVAFCLHCNTMHRCGWSVMLPIQFTAHCGVDLDLVKMDFCMVSRLLLINIAGKWTVLCTPYLFGPTMRLCIYKGRDRPFQWLLYCKYAVVHFMNISGYQINKLGFLAWNILFSV